MYSPAWHSLMERRPKCEISWLGALSLLVFRVILKAFIFFRYQLPVSFLNVQWCLKYVTYYRTIEGILTVCLQQPDLMVRKIAEFLGYSLTDEQISDIVKRSYLNVVKQDPSTNYSWMGGARMPSESQYMRKGIASVLEQRSLR